MSDTITREDFAAVATRALHRVCRRRESFVADDVWRELGDVPADVDMRALGSVMRHGVDEGWMVRTTETRRSRLVACHGHLRPVWRSLICRRKR